MFHTGGRERTSQHELSSWLTHLRRAWSSRSRGASPLGCISSSSVLRCLAPSAPPASLPTLLCSLSMSCKVRHSQP